MVLFDNDSNDILAEAMKNWMQGEMGRAQAKPHIYLTARGFKPQLQILDNECSDKLEQFFYNEKVKYQLVPPHLHRANAAECAITMFKDHFIAGLVSTDPSFPMHLW